MFKTIALFAISIFCICECHANQAQLSVNALIEEFTVFSWEPSTLGTTIYPLQVEEKANYSFPVPATLTCRSSTPRGWKVIVESDQVDLDDHFLLVSEDRTHFLRYVLVQDQGNRVIKNRETIIEASSFHEDCEVHSLYPTILGDQLMKVPAGYYIGTITATFIAR